MVSRSEIIRAVSVSLMLISSLIVIEFAVVQTNRDESFELRYGTQVLDFVVLPGEKLGAYVTWEISENEDHPMRYRAGFVDLASGLPIGEKIELNSRSQSLMLSPDGDGVIVACWDGELVHIKPETAAQSRQSIRHVEQVNQLVNLGEADAWLLNGRQLTVYDPQSSCIRWQHEFNAEDSLSSDYFDGSIYCGLDSGRVIQFDAKSGAVQQAVQASIHAIVAVVISPCGNYMATTLSDGRIVVGPRQLREQMSNPDSKTDEQWSIASTTLFRPAFSPCGRFLVAPELESSDRLCMYESATGRKIRSLGKHRGAISVTWSGNADNLYAWGYDGRIRNFAIDNESERWCYQPRLQQRTLSLGDWLKGTLGALPAGRRSGL